MLSQEDANKVLVWRILLAKKLGFTTILVPDYPSLFNVGRQNFDLAKVDPEFERIALEQAKIAEENGVEYFAPVNEYNHLLISNGYTIDEVVAHEKLFYGDLLPKIRAIYHGKIVIKNGAVNDWSNFTKESMVGVDLFGIGNAFTGYRTKENMSPMVEAANIVSARDKVPWFVSEFVVFRPIDQENWMGVIQSTAPQVDTYKESLDIFQNEAKGAVGFSFMGWTGVGRIRGTTAVPVLKSFYSQWQPTAKVVPSQAAMEIATNGGRINSIASWLQNIPSLYSFAFNLVTGKMGPNTKPDSQDPKMGEGGPGGCKGKAECAAYCAKPENQAECEKLKGNGDSGQNSGTNIAPTNGPQE